MNSVTKVETMASLRDKTIEIIEDARVHSQTTEDMMGVVSISDDNFEASRDPIGTITLSGKLSIEGETCVAIEHWSARFPANGGLFEVYPNDDRIIDLSDSQEVIRALAEILKQREF